MVFESWVEGNNQIRVMSQGRAERLLLIKRTGVKEANVLGEF